MFAHHRFKRTVTKIAWVGLLLLCIGPTYAARTTTMGQDEGSPASTTCPNKSYLAGFAVQYDTTMSGLLPYCANMTDDGAWSSGAQIHLDAIMSTVRPGGKRVDLFCPRDFYVVGFRGYSHVYGVHSIMQVTIACKNIKTSALYEIATPAPGAAVTEWRGARCGDDSVAEGVFGRINDGGYIVQFGLTCTQTRPVLLLLRDQARLTRGAREQATLTKVRPPVTTASAVTSPSASAAGAAPVVSPATPPAASPINKPAPGLNTPASKTFGEPKILQTEIVLPAPGSQATQGQLRVQVRTSAVKAGGDAEVEFSWEEARRLTPAGSTSSVTPGAPSSPIVWKVSLADLARGALVPASEGPTQTGQWLVRVRSTGGSAPGGWSTPVSFQYTALNKRQALEQAAHGGINPDAAALNPQPLPPKSWSAQPEPSRTRDWKQAPSTFNR